MLKAKDFFPLSQLFRTFFFVFLPISLNSFVWSDTPSWPVWKEETFQELPKIPGWCTREKAEKIMDFLYQTKPKRCIEIGTFAGSTTYPIARSLQYLGKGTVWTIDAWDRKKAIDGFSSDDKNFIWWSTVDIEGCFRQFFDLVARKRLHRWCHVIRSTSQEAISSFPDESIDFIYIDGSPSSKESFHDAILAYRKVKQGGYIWLNDAHCASRLDSVVYLMGRCMWLQQFSLSNQSVVFKKVRTSFRL